MNTRNTSRLASLTPFEFKRAPLAIAASAAGAPRPLRLNPGIS